MALTINSAQYNSGAEYDTVTGDIVTINNAKPYVRMKQVVCEINPVQDLHGYDNPWPAGGGKNLLKFPLQGAEENPVTKNGIKFTDNGDGSITLDGTSTAAGNTYYNLSDRNKTGSYVLVGSSFVVSVFGSVPGLLINYFYDNNSTQTTRGLDSDGNLFITGVDDVRQVTLAVQAGKSFDNVKIWPQVTAGTVAPTTYSPYSNICPISGWSEAKVTRTGKNLASVNSVTAGSGYVDIYNGVGIQNSITLSFKCNNFSFINGGASIVIMVDSDDKNHPITPSAFGLSANTVYNNRVSATFNLNYKVKRMSIPTSGYTSMSGSLNEIQLELGSTATAYEPYQGQTFTIDLDGTRYGGTLDVTRGKLRVTKYYFKGGWTQYAQSNGYKAYQRGSLPYAKYNLDVDNELMSNTIGIFGSFSSASMNKNIIQPPRQTSNTAYLALQEDADPSDVDLTYLLGTPIEVDLTPTEIKTLLGQNNVWADTNGDVTVVYMVE